MQKVILSFIAIMVLISCNSTPKNFTYTYTGKNTGLDERIDLHGIYITEHACDSSFFSAFRFYPDGKFHIATTSSINEELINCFEKGKSNNKCNYITEGLYVFEKDTIKTQVLWPVGNGCVIFRNYRVSSDKNIVNISDYIEPQHTNLAYMKNYPSFYINPCPKKALFMPIKKF